VTVTSIDIIKKRLSKLPLFSDVFTMRACCGAVSLTCDLEI